MNFDRIKYYYESGLWNVKMIRNAVRKGVINKEEFKIITGENY